MKRLKDDFEKPEDRKHVLLIISDQAYHKYNQDKNKSEVKKELLKEYPFMPLNIINEAIQLVEKNVFIKGK